MLLNFWNALPILYFILKIFHGSPQIMSFMHSWFAKIIKMRLKKKNHIYEITHSCFCLIKKKKIGKWFLKPPCHPMVLYLFHLETFSLNVPTHNHMPHIKHQKWVPLSLGDGCIWPLGDLWPVDDPWPLADLLDSNPSGILHAACLCTAWWTSPWYTSAW